MKQNLKKMLLALMVSFSLMGAISAQGQSEKVYDRVSDFYNEFIYQTGVSGPIHTLCMDIVNKCNGVQGYGYKYEEKWSWMGSQDIRCNVSSRKTSITGLQLRVKCPEGGRINQNLLGCYQELDKCPNGKVKGAGNECVVPCTGIGEDGTASPKGCVPVNNPECEEKERSPDTTGLILCPSNKPCAFYNPEIKDEETRKYRRECTFVHEMTHVNNEDKFRTACLSDGTLGAYYPDTYKDESLAYAAGARCLGEKIKECSSSYCKTKLESLKENMENQAKREMNNYCSYEGVNC